MNVIKCHEETKILEFNLYKKQDKAPFNFYADVEYLIEKRLIHTKCIQWKDCMKMF